jgi:antitoxin component YwqK of YwqJK toxin-antitoxin module
MVVDRVASEQLAYPGDGLHYRDGQPFTGVMEFRLPDGRLEAEEEYQHGLLSGRRREWHFSGGLQSEAECAWGGYHGRVRTWYEDGRLEADELYEYGIRTRGTRWDEQGRVTEVFELSEADPDYRTLELSRSAFGVGEENEPSTNPGNSS